MPKRKTPSGAELANLVTDARQKSLALLEGLSDEQLIGPPISIVNPLLWEIGHLAWFEERWILRHLHNEKPLLNQTDVLYDSMAVRHDTRWDLPLPSKQETLDYMKGVLDRVVKIICDQENPSEDDLYFYQMVGFHEYMHAEAFTYTRQTLEFPSPLASSEVGILKIEEIGGGPWPGYVQIPGGIYMLGGTPDMPFVFDNEKWAHPVEVDSFQIARAPVTNAEYAEFVDDGGYEVKELWSDEGWSWNQLEQVVHPVYWQKSVDRWQRRNFDQIVFLEPNHPVVNVNWFEAEAYCQWAGRRLPTEVEWELAASAEPDPDGTGFTSRKRIFPWGDIPDIPNYANLNSRYLGCVEVGAFSTGDSLFGCRQMIGNVWEWTASTFEPFPGFIPDPYKDFSQPWFGTRKVLRGGSWATRGEMIRNTWRNFFTPDRRDVFAGFRTCAKP